MKYKIKLSYNVLVGKGGRAQVSCVANAGDASGVRIAPTKEEARVLAIQDIAKVIALQGGLKTPDDEEITIDVNI